MKYFATDIFIKLAQTIRNGHAQMQRRSSQDKEYFFQDWFLDQLKSRYSLEEQGRNSHPDYILGKDEQIEGAELKSLANVKVGKRDASVNPCRTDIDFNSTVPCGIVPYRGKQLRTFYYFALYENFKDDPLRAEAIALCVVDGNFLNNDFNIASTHKNTSASGFGSYQDGFIRTRKMYRFPNPLTVPQLRYKNALVVEDGDTELEDGQLKLTGKLTKKDKDNKIHTFNIYELA